MFADKTNEFGNFKKEEFIDQVNYLIMNAYIQFDNELKKNLSSHEQNHESFSLCINITCSFGNKQSLTTQWIWGTPDGRRCHIWQAAISIKSYKCIIPWIFIQTPKLIWFVWHHPLLVKYTLKDRVGSKWRCKTVSYS